MVGSISTSVFLVAISINTLLTVIWGFKLSRFTTRLVVICAWVFPSVLAFVGLGVNAHSPDTDDARFYARSISLCFINHDYIPTYGLGLQYFWLMLAIAITIVCYVWISVAMLLHKQSPRYLPSRPNRRKNAPPQLSGHHPAFLVYPAIYFITTAPITLVGLLALSGEKISVVYFNLVSVMSALAGLLDSILWSTTILMSSSKELKDLGLDKYDFQRTPERIYGNIVWVEGAGTRPHGHMQDVRSNNRRHRWWRLQGDLRNRASRGSQDIIMESNLNEGIQLDKSIRVDYAPTTDHEVSDSYSIPKQYHLS